jgi:oligopeptide/dipeptide ABC transporter ATP-binding protein
MAPPEIALEVEGLVKHYAIRGSGARGAVVRAVDGVSFRIAAGETLALVGESGSGKSTVGRLILGLTPPTAGSVRLFGRRIDDLGHRPMRTLRRDLQLVFQDPYASLNPRMRVVDIVGEPLANFGLVPPAERRARVGEILARVGLGPEHLDRLPHEFSGGQRQRLGIARAIASRPRVVVCDEPVSALDVSVQAQVINLLLDLQAEFGMSYLFIAHDLAVVEHVSHRTAVMYLGGLVEIALTRELFAAPRHPYTRALLASVPVPDPTVPRRPPIEGELPSAVDPPPGCRFHTRCPLAEPRCRTEVPALRAVGDGTAVACHLA